MPARINGAAFSQQNLTGGLQYYIVYATSPGSFVDPSPNPPTSEEIVRSINIQNTSNIEDQSQKNFEILFQSIGLRALPTIMNVPEAVLSLAAGGAPTLTGEGFIWKFATERNESFMDYSVNDKVGLLIKELDGVILESGVRVTTVDGSPSAVAKNIEFVRIDNL